MTSWTALRKAMREAHRLGADFRIVGDDVEIAGELPSDLRERSSARCCGSIWGLAAPTRGNRVPAPTRRGGRADH